MLLLLILKTIKVCPLFPFPILYPSDTTVLLTIVYPPPMPPVVLFPPPLLQQDKHEGWAKDQTTASLTSLSRNRHYHLNRIEAQPAIFRKALCLAVASFVLPSTSTHCSQDLILTSTIPFSFNVSYLRTSLDNNDSELWKETSLLSSSHCDTH